MLVKAITELTVCDHWDFQAVLLHHFVIENSEVLFSKLAFQCKKYCSSAFPQK